MSLNLRDHADLVSPPPICYRALATEVRADVGEERVAEFVATTETPVDMGYGVPEVLRISGLTLSRYRSNPVVLNSHSRGSIQDIVGRADIRREDTDSGRAIVARVKFTDATEAGRAAWALVQDGSLRALSIGYAVQRVRELHDGDEDGEVKGPAFVVTKSELLEISVVPVPADPRALKRAYALAEREPAEEKQMADEQRADEQRAEDAAAPAGAREGDMPMDDDEEEDDDKGKKGKKKAAEAEDYDESEADDKPEEKAKAEPAAAVRKREVLAFTPPDLVEYAHDLFLTDPSITVEAAREALLTERARRLRPVGTPEPRMAQDQGAGKPLTVADFSRALQGG